MGVGGFFNLRALVLPVDQSTAALLRLCSGLGDADSRLLWWLGAVPLDASAGVCFWWVRTLLMLLLLMAGWFLVYFAPPVGWAVWLLFCSYCLGYTAFAGFVFALSGSCCLFCRYPSTRSD